MGRRFESYIEYLPISFNLINPFILKQMSKSDFIPYVFHTKGESAKSRRVTVVGTVDNSVLNLSVSCCSKKDHFTRKLGRSLATTRLTKGEIIASVPLKEVTLSNFILCAQAVAEAALRFGVHQQIEITLAETPQYTLGSSMPVTVTYKQV